MCATGFFTFRPPREAATVHSKLTLRFTDVPLDSDGANILRATVPGLDVSSNRGLFPPELVSPSSRFLGEVLGGVTERGLPPIHTVSVLRGSTTDTGSPPILKNFVVSPEPLDMATIA